VNRSLVLLVASTAACAWTFSAAAAAPAACNAVSFAEAGKALGVPVTAVTARTHGDATTCSYRASGSFKRLEVSILPFKSQADAKSDFHAMVTDPRLHLAPSVDLTGIGDEAHRFGPTVYVRKNGTVYVFTQLAPDPSGTAALRTISLAKASIARQH